MTRRVAACLGALGLAGCGALGPLELPLTATGTVPSAFSGIPGAGPDLGGFGGSVRQRLENQGLTADRVASARLTAGSVTVVSPAGGDLTFATTLEVWIGAGGLERRRVASIADFAAPSPVPFALDDVELTAYVTAPDLELELVLAQRSGQPRAAHDLKLELLLAVTLR